MYELNSSGEFVCDLLPDSPLPDNYTKVKLPQPVYTPKFIGNRLSSGEWVGEWVDLGIPTRELVNIERLWRDSELNRADIELNKVQDGMGTGTVSAWREYRCSLRNWPESPDFPDSTKRPVAPDA